MNIYHRLYIAKIAPVAETWREAIHRGQDVIHGGETIRESFSPDAFRRADPARVPVRLWHEDNKPVGTLSSLTTSNGWHIASFQLDHSLSRSSIALDSLHVGAPVSIGFASVRRDALLAEDGFDWYQDALLNEVSILRADQQPAFAGAQITQVLELPEERLARRYYRTPIKLSSPMSDWPIGEEVTHIAPGVVQTASGRIIGVR